MGKVLISLILSVFLIISVSWAEEKKEGEKKEKESRLEEIVVTATKTEKLLEESPVAVSVITSKDIANSTAKTVDEVLQNTPGTFYWNRTGLGEPHAWVQIRGFRGSNRNLSLLDGLPLNEASGGSIHWPGVPLSNVERIEEVRGPFSALYGGGAMGGVINIITKIPEKREFKASFSYGSNNTQIYTLSYGDKLFDKLSIALGYEGRKTDGYPTRIVTKEATSGVGSIPVSGWERTTDPQGEKALYIIGDRGDEHLKQDIFYGKLNFEITPKSNITFSFNYTDRLYDFKDYNTYLRNSAGNPVDSGDITFNDGGNMRSTIKPGDFLMQTGDSGRKQAIYLVTYNNELSEGIKLKVSLGLNDLQKSWSVRPDTNATLTGGKGEFSERPDKAYYADIQLNFPIAKNHLITSGINCSHMDTEDITWSMTNWTDKNSKTTVIRAMEAKSNLCAIYLQDEYLIHEKLSLYAGGRYDFWKAYDGKFILASPSKITNYPSKTDSYFSPKLSFHYRPYVDTVIRGSAGMSFRPPTVSELYRVFFHTPDRWIYGNPDLKPEVAASWEVGINQRLFDGKTQVSATYFESYVDDMITSVAIKTDPATGRVIETRDENIAKARIRGIETEVRQKINKYLSAFANFTWQDAITKKNPASTISEGKRLTYIPEIMWNVGLTLAKNGFDASLTTRYASKVYSREDNKDAARGVPWGYDSIFITDIKAGYQITKWVKASVEIKNLFDREYYYSYMAPGRTAMGTLTLTF